MTYIKRLKSTPHHIFQIIFCHRPVNNSLFTFAARVIELLNINPIPLI